MLLKSFAVNQDVVKEDDNTNAEEWLECGIHGSLKCVGRTREAEGHYCVLKMSPMSLKCSFVLFARGKANLIEARAQVEARKPAST